MAFGLRNSCRWQKITWWQSQIWSVAAAGNLGRQSDMAGWWAVVATTALHETWNLPCLVAFIFTNLTISWARVFVLPEQKFPQATKSEFILTPIFFDRYIFRTGLCRYFGLTERAGRLLLPSSKIATFCGDMIFTVDLKMTRWAFQWASWSYIHSLQEIMRKSFQNLRTQQQASDIYDAGMLFLRQHMILTRICSRWGKCATGFCLDFSDFLQFMVHQAEFAHVVGETQGPCQNLIWLFWSCVGLDVQYHVLDWFFLKE